MNKSQRIELTTGTTTTDKYIKVQLEQDVDTLEFMTLNITTKDAYQDFNGDYGVLVGRVNANGGIGVPNAKISVFVPLTDDDSENSSVASIYPYKTPRDKNNEGKRYNLLPRVSQYNIDTGTYKPKQPFGSFPIKPEIVTNQPFLDVYKKYYKYTAISNGAGDYMIFGVPIGVQTIHLSVDITDIGKYSMTPASMIKAGYPANLFVDGGKAIKPSDDLGDLPNIETQEIAVDIIPFWGDSENFMIGITRQDFRIRAILESNFTVFGTTMTMGLTATWGDPDRNLDNDRGDQNYGFYFLSSDVNNNIDIRVNRPAPPVIRVFTYNTNIPITTITSGALDPTNPATIVELDKSQYYELLSNGDFLLNIPCNRNKVVTNESGQDVNVPDDSPYGVFTEFYGMMLIDYPDLPIDKTYDRKFNGPNPAHKARGRLKIPQTEGLRKSTVSTNEPYNQVWRKEYQLFQAGEIYSVAQFLPTKYASHAAGPDNIATADDTENRINFQHWSKVAGSLMKVAGPDNVSPQQAEYDTDNYLIDPATGSTPQFRYDFPSNAVYGGEQFFGAQWINLCLFFPQYVWAYDAGNNRGYKVADIFHNDYTSGDEYFVTDNSQAIFAGITNTRFMLKGDAFRTKFINIPKTELSKLYYGTTTKSLNIRKWNTGNYYGIQNADNIIIDPSPFEYQNHSEYSTTGREYTRNAWDINTYTGTQVGTKKTAFLFRGMYENDCVKLLFDQNII